MTPEQLDEIEKMADHPDLDDLCDLAAHALPLVKALREAWAALDQVSSDDRMSEAQITAAITEAQKERDEARSEAERLRITNNDCNRAIDWAKNEMNKLRDVVRQVHELAHKAIATDWRIGLTKETLTEIHKITKGEE